jgi:GNAT superfamily N-acetyltransferase
MKDVEAIVRVVGELLSELGGTPPDPSGMREATRTLLEDPDAGMVLIAHANETLIAVLAASWQTAIHVPGRYGLIQDLWVDRSWRRRAVGGALLAELSRLARERGIWRIEVGLPSERFQQLDQTQAFYADNGFEALGPRMRLMLG